MREFNVPINSNKESKLVQRKNLRVALKEKPAPADLKDQSTESTIPKDLSILMKAIIKLRSDVLGNEDLFLLNPHEQSRLGNELAMFQYRVAGADIKSITSDKLSGWQDDLKKFDEKYIAASTTPNNSLPHADIDNSTRHVEQYVLDAAHDQKIAETQKEISNAIKNYFLEPLQRFIKLNQKSSELNPAILNDHIAEFIEFPKTSNYEKSLNKTKEAKQRFLHAEEMLKNAKIVLKEMDKLVTKNYVTQMSKEIQLAPYKAIVKSCQRNCSKTYEAFKKAETELQSIEDTLFNMRTALLTDSRLNKTTFRETYESSLHLEPTLKAYHRILLASKEDKVEELKPVIAELKSVAQLVENAKHKLADSENLNDKIKSLKIPARLTMTSKFFKEVNDEIKKSKNQIDPPEANTNRKPK
jgi:hypothetical protein